MRSLLLIAASVVFTSELSAQAPERDPWKGFALGSTVTMRKLVEVKDKPTVEKRIFCKIESVSAEGSAGIWTRQVVNGKESIWTSYHVHGGDPEHLGLVRDSKTEDKLTIDGKVLSVIVSKWRSAKDNKDLEKIAKSFPEILKQGGLRGAKDVEVGLILYETTNADVEVPYHEIATPGVDISIGRRVLKAEFKFVRLGEDGKPSEESHHVETVKRLDARLDIKGKQVKCVVFEVQSSYRASKREESKSSGEIWYSNDVPGREVKKAFVAVGPNGVEKSTMEVEDFEVFAAIAKLNLAKLRADKQRPVIPDPAWNGMRLGAWMVTVSEIVDRRTKKASSFDVFLSQVVQIRDRNVFVTASKTLQEKGWGEESSRLVDLARPSDEGESKSVREEIRILGGNVKCDKETRTTKSDWSSRTSSKWLPQDEKWKKLLAGSGLEYVKLTESTTGKDSIREWKDKSEGAVISPGTKLSVSGKAHSCVVLKTLHFEEEKPWYVDYTYYSGAVPTRLVARISVGNRDYSFFHVLDFGEVDKEAPNLEQLRPLYQQAIELLKTVNLEKVE